ncbi:toxin-antitoxin system, antitoxin component [bacterium]|nr:toxin-antitoxin system, antitoxin component [Candidatus Neomarinimicrobiota bacterium]MCK5684818.1 toxin-antitoxin system, antitoxin component [bacterium]
MPQISLYVDKDTLTKIETLSKMQHSSISKWVRDQIQNAVHETYPDNFFNLFGSVSNNSVKRPDPLPISLDAVREEL